MSSFTATELRDAETPPYEIAEDLSNETPGEAHIVKRVAVSDSISEASLRKLLVDLYSEAMTVSDWEYHDGPTQVAVYVHSDRVPEMNTNWIGKVFKGPTDRFLEFSTNEDALREHNRSASL